MEHDESTVRHQGPATVRRSYMTEFIVECPKCKQAAFVTCDNAYTHCSGKLTCTSCSHVEHVDDLIRYRILIKKYCNNCGSAIDSTIPELKVKKSKISFACPTCGALEEFQPRNEQYQIQYKSNKSTGSVNDPVFNLPLWLQAEVKGSLFWAYNRQHLHDIKEYVEAKLRERQTTRYTTMVERLPSFIKAAKNRDAILKTIEKLVHK